MKHILVTGANGQLGKSIQEIAKNYTDYIFYFKGSKELDITNANQIQTIFSLNKFDYCINCAAYTSVEQAEKTPEIAYLVNAEGTKNIALACKKKCVTLIHISTDYVFDGRKDKPYSVFDRPNPINEYGKSKWEGEKRIQKILKKHFIIRTSWLYSKIYGVNFYKTIVEKAKRGEVLSVTEEQIGCPTNALNLAMFIMGEIVREKTNFGIKHFTDDIPMTWYDFAQEIILENNLQDKVTLKRAENYRTFARRPINSILKNTLI